MEVDAKLMLKRTFDVCLGVDVQLCEIKCEEILAGKKEFQNRLLSKRQKRHSWPLIARTRAKERSKTRVHVNSVDSLFAFFASFLSSKI